MRKLNNSFYIFLFTCLLFMSSFFYKVYAQGEESKTTEVKDNAYNTNEIMTLKLRFKAPDSEVSKLIERLEQDEDVNKVFHNMG